MSDGKNYAPKKTEMIEVRVSVETKRDFLAACRSKGQTASEVVRSSIDDYIAGARGKAQEVPRASRLLRHVPTDLRRKRYAVMGVAMLGLTAAVAMPSAAQTDLGAMFDALDVNRDGGLSLEEYAVEKPPAIGGKERHRLQLRAAKRLPQGVTAAIREQTPALFRLPQEPSRATPDGASILHQNLEAAAPPSASEWRAEQFKHIDGNGDGRISRDEFERSIKLLLSAGFRELDGNEDGSLSAEELRRTATTFIAAPSESDARVLHGAQLGPVVSIEALDQYLRQADADADGGLTEEEYLR